MVNKNSQRNRRLKTIKYLQYFGIMYTLLICHTYYRSTWQIIVCIKCLIIIGNTIEFKKRRNDSRVTPLSHTI